MPMTPVLTWKSLHLISMVAWFAGLFYIFRLYVYHSIHKDSREITKAYEVMERKLLSFIIWPASFATLGFGTMLLLQVPGHFTQGWIYLKLLFIGLLFGYQTLAQVTFNRFQRKDFYLSERACRLWNEFPTLCLIVIVLLAVFKPF